MGGLRIRKELLDQPLGQRNIHIPCDHDRGTLGCVPFLIEIHEPVPAHLFDGLFQADGEAAAQQRVGHGEMKLIQLNALFDRVARQLFTQDDAALAVDLLFLQEHAVEIVAEQLQRLTEHRLVHAGQLQFVDRFLEGGVCVGVRAESHAQPLKGFHHGACGEMFGAVEGHVLQEVGHALLVVLLHE